jgi:putative spermidine/putrescine transport system substrate-binding protein
LVVAAAALSAAALALTGCVQSNSAAQNSGDDSKGSSKTVTVFISADTNVQDLWQKSLVPAFEKANPGYSVKIDFDLHGQHDQQTVAKLTAATLQKKDPGYDIIDGGLVKQMATSGLLATVNDSKLPNLKKVPESIIKAGGKDTIPYRASSVLLAYDSTTITTPPKTLDDLLAWIKANPGKFAYNSPASGGSGGAFVTTVLDKTIPADDRAKMVTDYLPDLESEWDEGFATLASLNPYVYQQGVYPNGNNQVLDLLSSGQVTMAPVWSDQFTTGLKNGQIPDTIKTTQISDPSLTGSASYLGIPKASPRTKAAFKLAEWLLTPDAQALVSDSISGYPVIDLSELPQDVQDLFKDADISHLRSGYFSQMTNDMNKLWSEKVPGK